MSAYFDASAIVSLFVGDSFSGRIDAFLGMSFPHFLVSDLGAAEFASAIGIRLRIEEVTKAGARQAFAAFDSWMARAATQVEMVSGDIRAAEAMLRRLDLVLRTPDALHIAIARRLGAELVTFDKKMAASARKLGLTVAGV